MIYKHKEIQMDGTVYIVHCIDTEGPLYEAPIVAFQQIKNIFGIDIEPTRENLIKLQKGTLNIGGRENAIKELLDIHRITTRGTWEEIDEMLEVVTSNRFRNKLLDSAGNGWVFNWFCMDHVGFTGDNPRRRDAGYHKIYDRYVSLIEAQQSRDYIGFHYHPLPISGNYNDSGTAYWGGENLNQILCRRIIDRKWFPSAFRPGFHTERPDSNWFLEQWIPYDYGNQSMRTIEESQQDLSNGRFGDWRRAPLEWIPYHPDHDDYQQKGSSRRWITRCLNMYARIRQISEEDVDEAFLCASKGTDVILAFTDHDYKDMEFEIDRVRNMISASHKKFPKVRFLYSNAVDAMRNVLKQNTQDFHLHAELVQSNIHPQLEIRAEGDIFGPQPFLAIKTTDGRYIWENFDVSEPRKVWTYTFDSNTICLSEIEKIGVASNSACGVASVVHITPDGKTEEFVYNRQ